jgi:hypothetical protein
VSQVLARGFLIRNGAKLFFPPALGDGALGAETVDRCLRERFCERKRCCRRNDDK